VRQPTQIEFELLEGPTHVTRLPGILAPLRRHRGMFGCFAWFGRTASIGYRRMLVPIGGSGRLLWREELGECLGERRGMGQGGGVPGAGNLLYPCVGDAVGTCRAAARS
jgi:hypothetical protein